MEVDKRYLQEDRMSDCRSFGRTCRPSSQSQKISIGIMVDPLPEKRYGASKENLSNIVNLKMENSNNGKSVEGKNKGKGVINANEALVKLVNNPTMATCVLNQSQHTSRTVPEAATNSKLDCGAENLKTVAGYTSKRNEEKDQGLKRVEDFVTPQNAFGSDKVKTKDTAEDRTATLRMKLLEILGTVSSPKSQPSHDCDIGVTDIMPKQSVDRKDETVIKSKRKSENIETPAHTLRRPVTRSLTAKKVSTRKNLDKGKAVLTSSCERTFQSKNIFSFEDGMSGRGKTPAHGGPSTSTKKNNRNNNIRKFTVEPHKINFNENNEVDGIKGTTNKCEASTPVAISAPLGNNSGTSYGFPHLRKSGNTQKRVSYLSPGTDFHLSQEGSATDKPGNIIRPEVQEKGQKIQMEKRDQERDSWHSPVRNSPSSQGTNGKHQPENFNTPIVPENGYHVENFISPSPKNDTYSEEDCQSPTFRFNSPIINSFPSIMPKTDQVKQVLRSHKVADGSIGLQNISSFKDLRASRLDDYISDAETELSNDEAEVEDHQKTKPSHSKEKEDSEDELSKSSSSSEETESSDDDSPVLKETTDERSKFASHQSKRLRRNEAGRVGKLTPTPPSQQAVRENDWSPEPLEQNEGDDLERIVTLFALAVKKFQNKMKMTVRKKSSEIVNSVTEEIRLQLQKIESQIQADMGKLTNTSKSKRKRLEAGLQEQEDQLRLIHDKFKQDIGQYLEECKSTVEELQMHQNEFKGAIKNQKASHQKFITEAEKAIEVQLIGANRRITDADKLARRRMAALKHVISQCLSEDVLC